MGKAIGEMFGALFPVVAPIPMAPVFVSLTADRPAQRQRIAVRSAFLTLALLLIFLFVGEPLLHTFGISLEALQIAGGIIIALAGLALAREPLRLEAEEDGDDVAFSPLAMPLLAGPGALGVIMAVEARRASNISLVGFVIAIALIAVCVYVCFIFGAQLVRLIGLAGMDAIRRVFGLVVLAIGVEMIVYGIHHHEAVRSALG